MSEERRAPGLHEGFEAAGEGWECLSVLGEMACEWCAHNVMALILDDWEVAGLQANVAVCLLCGQTMVRWTAQPEDR